MFSREIMICLEQKSILLTDILNLTKQIEVRCREPEIELEHLLEQRGSLMERVEKCSLLLKSLAGQLPSSQQPRALSILDCSMEDKTSCDEEEQKALQLSIQCRSLFQRAAALDRSARESVQSQYEDTALQLKRLRGNGTGTELFSGYL